MARYSVIHVNIGEIHAGDKERDARAAFNDAVTDSKAGYGRGAHEQVVLFRDGEPMKEHTPAPIWSYEYTDTFGGEANYSWVKRGRVESETEAGAVRKVKAALNMTAYPCRRTSYGEMVELRPAGMCTVIFITPEYE
jgi:hypothetical protein